MKILITGGTGYLGSHLVKRMLKKGNEIACIVKSQQDLGRIESLRKEIKLIPVADMDSGIFEFSPEIVIHAACVYSRAGVPEQDIFRGNLSFPFTVLQIARMIGVKKWINTASSLPHMTNSYTLSKYEFSKWGEFYSKDEEMSFVNLRLEHFYGKGAPKSNFLAWVTESLKSGETLNLTLGTQKRDFIYIDDVLRVYDTVLNFNFENHYTEIPVGTGEAPSIREVVEYLKALIGSNSKLHFGAIPMKKDEPSSHCDTRMLQSMGILPIYKWKIGLKNII